MQKRIIYGIHPIREALRAGSAIERIITATNDRTTSTSTSSSISDIIKTARSRNISVDSADISTLSAKCACEHHQGVIAIMKELYSSAGLNDIIARWKKSHDKAFFLILDSIEDPQNMGTLIRSAEAFGVHGVVIPKDRSARITGAVVKASAGATEHIPITIATNINATIKRLKQEGVWIVGLDGQSDNATWESDLDIDIAIVVGSEGKGLRHLVRENCDLLVSIPMSGLIASLNAAQAASIALYEVRRTRATGGV